MTNLKFLWNDEITQSATAAGLGFASSTGTDTNSSLSDAFQAARHFGWRSTSLAASHDITVSFAAGASLAFDTFALARAHVLAGQQSAVSLAVKGSADGSAWTTWTSKSNLAASDLVGPNAEDWIAWSNTTQAGRYWRLSLAGGAAWRPILDKIFWGTAFDPGKDPFDVMIQEAPGTESARVPYKQISLSYAGLTYAKAQELITKLGGGQDIRPVLIFTTTFHGVLMNEKCIHCTVEKILAPPLTANYNNLTIVLREQV